MRLILELLGNVCSCLRDLHLESCSRLRTSTDSETIKDRLAYCRLDLLEQGGIGTTNGDKIALLTDGLDADHVSVLAVYELYERAVVYRDTGIRNQCLLGNDLRRKCSRSLISLECGTRCHDLNILLAENSQKVMKICFKLCYEINILRMRLDCVICHKNTPYLNKSMLSSIALLLLRSSLIARISSFVITGG